MKQLKIQKRKECHYSPEIGGFSESTIKRILKSKFKVERTRVYINGKTVRCVQFKEQYLNRIKATYSIPKQIKIKSKSSDATDATDGNCENKGNLEENSTTENLENHRKHDKNGPKHQLSILAIYTKIEPRTHQKTLQKTR